MEFWLEIGIWEFKTKNWNLITEMDYKLTKNDQFINFKLKITLEYENDITTTLFYPN